LLRPTPLIILIGFKRLPSDSTRVCAFWDYTGIANGVSWSSYRFFNGQLDEGGSTPDQEWGGGQSGDWWGSLVDEDGLSPGVYEIVLEVEGTILATDSVFVGGDRSAAMSSCAERSPGTGSLFSSADRAI